MAKPPTFTRGYEKLASAARSFSFDFKDKVVLDIGSSTGGFTRYVLDHGAKKVVAVEKGTRQMVEPLRSDPRVELHEKTDILAIKFKDISGARPASPPLRVAGANARRSSAPPEMSLNLTAKTPVLNRRKSAPPETPLDFTAAIPVPDVVVADVSFTSLRPILLHVRDNIAGPNTDLLMMLKPQFEAEPKQLVNGVVKNEKIRREIIKQFEFWLKTHGFVVKTKHDNALSGKNGNIERFYWLKISRAYA